MDEERMKVLKMLEGGKVDAAEAARLLEALAEGATAADGAPARAAGGGRGKALRIRVYERGSERARVNVNVPLRLAKWALKFAPASARARLGEREIDLDELERLLDEGPGEVITVEDAEKGERVEITIE